MCIFLRFPCNSKTEILKKVKKENNYFLKMYIYIFFSIVKPYGVHPQACSKKKTAAFSCPSHVLRINAV